MRADGLTREPPWNRARSTAIPSVSRAFGRSVADALDYSCKGPFSDWPDRESIKRGAHVAAIAVTGVVEPAKAAAMTIVEAISQPSGVELER